MPQTITQAELCTRVAQIFAKGGVRETSAHAVAEALVQAEVDGQMGHGLSRIPSYLGQVATGKVNGDAAPTIELPRPALLRVNARGGFAYPAFALAHQHLPGLARTHGISAGAIFHSHHFGQAGRLVERYAEAGLVALLFGNSPAAIAFHGGRKPAMGTNPIAFAAPIPGGAPLVIDLAVSVAARGKIIRARDRGEDIPEGWALDANGAPTTNPDEALKGSMVPIADAKGAALAMMVEIMAAALTGGAFGFEASSLFDSEGPAPDLGQLLIVIDPDAMSHSQFAARMSVFAAAVDMEQGTRLPGTSRLARRAEVARSGITLDEKTQDMLARFEAA